MKAILEKLLNRGSLEVDETSRLFDALVGNTAPEMKAALLTALRAKGETETEIYGMALKMRQAAIPLPPDLREALDTCGTGGDGSRSLNLSTISALILSALGMPIVKHGNRSVSSTCGSADLLEKLGFPLDLPPESTVKLFRETRFGFLFAPLYHPAMKAVVPIRKILQVRTIFNFLGPLSNPAQVVFQILGVPSADRVRPFADVLKRLGLRSALVVHGEPGLDEVSPCGKTRAVYFLLQGPLKEEKWSPADFGLAPVPPDRLAVSGPEESVSRTRDILAGTGSPDDVSAVSLNAAAGLWVSGRTGTIADALTQVRACLFSGHARVHLDRILHVAQELKSHAGHT